MIKFIKNIGIYYILLLMIINIYIYIYNLDILNRKLLYIPDMYFSLPYEPNNEISMYNNKIIDNSYINTNNFQLKNDGLLYKNNIDYYYYLLKNKKIKIDLKNGKKFYEIYCKLCHGINGYGDGELVKNDKIHGVPNYKNIKNINIKYIYDIITYGKNSMLPYSQQISIKDRLDISKYVILLSKSTNKNFNK